MSAALFKEDENRKQRLVFFVYKSLADAETRYSHLEHASLALQVATKKLLLYFQAHPIVVLIELPLRSTIHKPDLSGNRARWAIELSEFGIQYKPRLAKKGQVLTYFLAKIPQSRVSLDSLNWWTLNDYARVSRQSKAILFFSFLLCEAHWPSLHGGPQPIQGSKQH